MLFIAYSLIKGWYSVLEFLPLSKFQLWSCPTNMNTVLKPLKYNLANVVIAPRWSSCITGEASCSLSKFQR